MLQDFKRGLLPRPSLFLINVLVLWLFLLKNLIHSKDFQIIFRLAKGSSEKKIVERNWSIPLGMQPKYFELQKKFSTSLVSLDLWPNFKARGFAVCIKFSIFLNSEIFN